MKSSTCLQPCFCDCTARMRLRPYYQGSSESSDSTCHPEQERIPATSGPLQALSNCRGRKATSIRLRQRWARACPHRPLGSCGERRPHSPDRAVLSGTISYILTNGKARLFSQLVSAEAKEKVYTEPDPRDISGGRCPRAKRSSTSGSRVSLNYGDISIEPLLPAGLCRLHHRRVYGDAVRDRYRIVAPARRKPHRTARPPAMSLRITPTRPRFAQGIDSSSPLESLGTETCGFPPRNGIAEPLVVRGPGAGAEVTAGGVFADILKLAE